MAETYLQLAQQIEELQQRAASVKQQEMAEVIERIRLAIKAYGLTVEQLFGQTAGGSSGGAKAGGRSARARPSGAKYRDGSGNVWSGRGPRPRWLRTALAAGKSLEDFAASGADSGGPSGPARGGKKKPQAVAKYRDDAGNSWSGRGPKPRWFKAALEAGKTPDELAT